MHLGLDHGGYWANDEGFLIPLIRHLDDPTGDGSASRFYRNRSTGRSAPSAAAGASRCCSRGAGRPSPWIVAVIVAALRTSLTDAGDAVAGVFGLLPGHELVSGTIDGVGNAVAVIFNSIGLTAIPEALAAAGRDPRGVDPDRGGLPDLRSRRHSWMAHDALERTRIRREDFDPPGHPSARGEAVLLIGGLLAVVLAAFVVRLELLVLWLALAASPGWSFGASADPLDGDWFAVLPEDLAQDRALLAERRVRLRTTDEVGHEVRVRGPRPRGRVPEAAQTRLDGPRVTVAPRAFEPGLVALDDPGGTASTGTLVSSASSTYALTPTIRRSPASSSRWKR